jgi:hypothetical protein
MQKISLLIFAPNIFLGKSLSTKLDSTYIFQVS